MPRRCSPTRRFSKANRSVRYGYTVRNDTNQAVKNVDFWVYAPVKQTPTQLTEHIKTSHPYNLLQDRHGNQIMHFHFDVLPPYARKMIAVDAQLLLAQERNPIPTITQDLYLQAEPFIEVNAEAVQQQAATLKGVGVMETAQNIYHWLTGNIRYIGYVRDDHGALYALKNKKGDCTEFMNLFNALTRANGIQARGVGGYVVSENATVKSGDYHNWAEFYADNTWHMVDAQEQVFGERQADYIAMRIIGEDKSNPLNGVHRFRISNEKINVVMN